MPGAILDMSTTIKCSLMGSVVAATGAPNVQIMGQPVLIQTDTYTIPECPDKKSPCATGTWQAPSTKVLAGGAPVLITSSIGMGQPAPHKFSVLMVQQKVFAN